ncbi:N-acetylmuramoyl-L-alanine amidase [Planomonospora parontospora]|uniref:N-acetylmuramoyl-L-alanine amidase n=1 Tax=Planomonospora parontospora TaxID=58119 RepID=UPI00166FE5EC|nr:N-acetylmuramoyl-L-alanine amidase [Planomonospora parontospora]GGL48740.1 N-acetylmuramoyl-L-alanine amidase [Planomonospora parontospora subsp. antibiotica]GII18863.1 N-acetylmuramoyl-L-alanine amidase [Planomonospora parontospora subsp. antibiotica]
MTSRALAAALVLCGLGVAACGGAPDDGAAGPASPGPATSPADPGASAPAGSPDSDPPAPPAEEGTAPPSGETAASPSGETTATSDSTTPAPGGSAAVKPLRGKVVVIDPGHNGHNYRNPSAINRQVDVLTHKKACDTTGTATDDGYAEAAFTWDVSRRLKALLESRGATVKLTRPNNTGVGPCITERAAIGNRARADAAVSVHADGARATDRGFHVIIPKKINGPVDPVVDDSEKLGRAVRNAFRSGTGLPYSTYIGRNALSFRNDLGGLNLSRVPKVFIECGNMRNAGEARKFRNAQFRERIALSLANGLQDYLT